MGVDRNMESLRGQLTTLFDVPIPQHAPDQPASSMDSVETQSQLHHSEARSSPPASSIPATRPRSPDSNKADCGYTKAWSIRDTKDPSHPAYQTNQYRHVPEEERSLRPYQSGKQASWAATFPPTKYTELHLPDPNAKEYQSYDFTVEVPARSNKRSPLELEDIPEEDLPCREEVLKPEEDSTPEELRVLGLLIFGPPLELYRTLLDGCRDYF